MSHDHDVPDVPDELASTAERLRTARPAPGPDALDRVQRRITSRRAPLSRLAPTLAVATSLAVGLVMTGAGTSLAISGLSSPSTAVDAQYGAGSTNPTTTVGSTNTTTTDTNTNTNTNTTMTNSSPSLGGKGPSGPTSNGNAPSKGNGPASQPGEVSAGVVAPSVAQAPRQIAADGTGKSLPFTGFAAIPILGAGILLLLAGATLRRRALER